MNFKSIVAAMLIGASSTAAMAADLPTRKPAPPPVYVAPVFTWTGFYAGVDIGYAWDKIQLDSSPMVSVLYLGNLGGNWQGNGWQKNGVVGGGHVGYNYQFNGPFIVGIEGDVGGSSISSGGVRASVRGRVGYAIWDRAMIFATGGLAIDDVSVDFGWPTGRLSKTYTGWNVGGGIEYAFLPNWSAVVQYRYSDLGNTYVSRTGDTVRPKQHAVTAGVSYHFNWSNPVAVVAKY